MRRRWVVPVAVLAVSLGLAGCIDGKFLESYASCPAADGADCTADAQARVDALAEVPGITEVVLVERSENIDKAPSRYAEVLADVADEQEALEVAARALAVLDDWPEHETGGLSLLLTADPPVDIQYVGRQSSDLPETFEPCPDPDCADVFEQVQAGVEEEYDGVGPLSYRREGDTLRVSGRVASAEAELVSRAVDRNILDAGFRVAPRVDVVIRGTAPLSLEYHVEGDVVCGTPPIGSVDCTDRPTVPFR